MGEMNPQTVDLTIVNSDHGAGTSSRGTDEDVDTDNEHDCLNDFQLVEPVNKELFEKFLHCLKCSGICIPPIYFCTKGHHICKECQQGLKQCWICKTKFKGGKNFFYEYCFENSTFKCKYRREGCQETVLGKEIRNHLLNCDYRPINCIMCAKNDIPYTKFLKHYADSHNKDIISRKHGKFRCRYGQDFADAGTWKNITAIEFDGNTFFPFAHQVDLKIQNQSKIDKKIGIVLCIFGNEKDAQKYNVHISLTSETEYPAAKKPKRCLTWEGPVMSIQVDSKKIMDGGICFVTSPVAIKTIYEGLSGWTPTFKITRAPDSTAEDHERITSIRVKNELK